MAENGSLNLDHDEARSVHRIVRAMHDGECPKCHEIHDSRAMARHTLMGKPIGWTCPSCRFSITAEESDAALKLFAPFMERNLAVFEKWRAALTA